MRQPSDGTLQDDSPTEATGRDTRLYAESFAKDGAAGAEASAGRGKIPLTGTA